MISLQESGSGRKSRLKLYQLFYNQPRVHPPVDIVPEKYYVVGRQQRLSNDASQLDDASMNVTDKRSLQRITLGMIV